MTTNVILRLFLHGLVAFTPNQEFIDKPSALTAYLIEQDHHHPFLAFEILLTNQCPVDSQGDTKCEVDHKTGGAPKWCICKIGGNENIYFDPPPAEEKREFELPTSKPPASRDEAAQILWLTRMSSIVGGKVYPSKDKLNRYSHADIKLGLRSAPKSALTCHLDQGEKGIWPFTRIYPVGFFKNSQVPPRHSQAVAEYVMFEQSFSAPPTLLIKSRDRDKSEPYLSIKIYCDGNGHCQDLLISNGTVETTCTGANCGKHFENYLNLPAQALDAHFAQKLESPSELFITRKLATCENDPLTKRQDLSDRQATYNLAPLTKQFNKVVLAVDTRIICPMALFDPSQ